MTRRRTTIAVSRALAQDTARADDEDDEDDDEEDDDERGGFEGDGELAGSFSFSSSSDAPSTATATTATLVPPVEVFNGVAVSQPRQLHPSG